MRTIPVSRVPHPQATIFAPNNDDFNTPIWFAGPSTLAFPASWGQFGSPWGVGLYSSTGRGTAPASTIIELGGFANQGAIEKADVSENGNGAAIFDSDTGPNLVYGTGAATRIVSFSSVIDDIKANTSGGAFVNSSNGLFKVNDAGVTRLGNQLMPLFYSGTIPAGGLETGTGMVAGVDPATNLVNVYSSYGRSVRTSTAGSAWMGISHNGIVSAGDAPEFGPNFTSVSYSQNVVAIAGLDITDQPLTTATNDIGALAWVAGNGVAQNLRVLYQNPPTTVFAVGQSVPGGTVASFSVSKDRWLNRRNEMVVSYRLTDGSNHVGLVRLNAPIIYSSSVTSVQAGSPSIPVTLTGFNFDPSSVIVQASGTTCPVTNLTPTSVTFTLSSSLLGKPGALLLLVGNQGATIHSNFVTIKITGAPA